MKSNKLLVKRAFIALLVGLVVSFAIRMDNWSPHRIATSKAIGEEICVALDTYHGQFHRYPADLNDLVPQFLPVLRNPTAGSKKWKYHVSLEHDTYILQFRDAKGSATYYKERIGWSYDDGSF